VKVSFHVIKKTRRREKIENQVHCFQKLSIYEDSLQKETMGKIYSSKIIKKRIPLHF